MRVVCVFFAVIGGCALVAATAIEIAVGHPADISWGLLSAPFYVAGVAGVLSGRTGALVPAPGAGTAGFAADDEVAHREAGPELVVDVGDRLRHVLPRARVGTARSLVLVHRQNRRPA